ncbi:hypothetical protein PMI01_03836 [Caulobacter sp. AP07]|uniref:MFS transporter n=1 Tax=Caulobacter sp. AP07 TaxID=1144304 RepID=UPI0002720C6E|nr:MFS transporter [Caulobacter sp. AP07]EJL27355.1 hypothetical protein PMI01_03836 [Caulobacter sp. AP07]
MAFNYRRTEYVALAVGAASGSLVFGALPLTVGAATTVFGGAGAGGTAAAAELLAMGLASMIVSAKLAALPGRVTAMIGGLLLLLGQLLSWFAIVHANWPLFLAARLIAGAGEGGLYTVSNAFAAKAPRPDRAFTMIAFGQTIFNALFFTGMAILNAAYDPVRVLVFFSVFAGVACLTLIGAPNYLISADQGLDFDVEKKAFTPLVRRVLIGFGVYSVALFLLFPYAESVGLANGLSHAQIAAVFGFSALFALLGPAITASLGVRFGRLAPILVAIAFQIAAIVAVVYSRHIIIWGGGELTSIMMLYLLTPLMFSLISELEPSGRAAAVATAVMAITAAIGPAIGGAIMSATGSYAALGWVNVLAYVLMAALVWKPLLVAGRNLKAKITPLADSVQHAPAGE